MYDEKTRSMERLLTEKHFSFDRVRTTDADTPYLVICGIEPIHYEDFLIWISEQNKEGECCFNGQTLAELGFSP